MAMLRKHNRCDYYITNRAKQKLPAMKIARRKVVYCDWLSGVNPFWGFPHKYA
jgi:hypothetical protein